MAETRVYVNTWGCECGFTYQDDPEDRDTWIRCFVMDRQLMNWGNLHGLSAPPQGKCPACWLGLNDERVVYDRDLAGIVDLAAMSITSVKDPDSLDSEVREVRQYNKDTGEAEIVEIPLSKEDVAAQTQKINKALDSLSEIAVQELDPPEALPADSIAEKG